MPSVLISGYYGFANPGDEAILRVLTQELRAAAPDVTLAVLSGNPAETRQTYGVDAVEWSEPVAIANAVRAADLVLVGGGGLFHDYSGFIPDGLFTAGNWGLGYHVTAALLGALYRKPVALHAVGVGPLFSKHGRRFVRAAADAAAQISVRDPASAELLVSLGIEAARVHVTADPGFALAAASPERAAEILAGEGVSLMEKPVGVVVRHWSFGVHPVYWQQEVGTAMDAFLDAHGGDALLIPFQHLEGEQEDDFRVASRIHAGMRHSHTGRAHVLQGSYPPEELAALIGSCRLLVGMRLHALIFAACAGVPFVGISYDPKVARVMEPVGGRTVDLGALTRDLLAAAMNEALAGGAVSAPAVAAQRDTARAEIRRLLEWAGAPPAPLRPAVIDLLGDAALGQMQTESRLRRQLDLQAADLRRLAAVEEQLTHAQAHQEAARAECEALVQKSATLTERLAAAEADLAASREQFAQQERYLIAQRARLAGYRAERAWRLMLVARKAYTLLARRGWSGRFRFLLWAPGLLFGRTGDLTEFELEL